MAWIFGWSRSPTITKALPVACGNKDWPLDMRHAC
jgi:hypothetical protein